MFNIGWNWKRKGKKRKETEVGWRRIGQVPTAQLRSSEYTVVERETSRIQHGAHVFEDLRGTRMKYIE